MGNVTATAARRVVLRPPVPYRTFTALVSAGFRRYSTYRQATLAGIFTNTIFGFLRCYVLLAVTPAGNGAGGYDRAQIATYVWVSQALIATVGLWGDTLLADRIRTGEVVSDLLRPVPPVLNYLATDLGRAGFAALTRFVAPLFIGALAFHLFAPHRLASYPLFVISVGLSTVVCFGCRYLVNAAAYWLLDGRGAQIVWMLASGVLTGLYFPLSYLPAWLAGALWLGTPFPSVIQAPVDILVERQPLGGQLGLVGLQAGWAVVMVTLAALAQRLGERTLVTQGG